MGPRLPPVGTPWRVGRRPIRRVGASQAAQERDHRSTARKYSNPTDRDHLRLATTSEAMPYSPAYDPYAGSSGRRGRGFESRHPDQMTRCSPVSPAGRRGFCRPGGRPFLNVLPGCPSTPRPLSLTRVSSSAAGTEPAAGRWQGTDRPAVFGRSPPCRVARLGFGGLIEAKAERLPTEGALFS
jgi:hypothetical protein